MSCVRLSKLITAIKNGDDKAFETLYLKTRRGVFAFLYSYFHNSHDSEDAMHAVYVKIKQNAHSFKDDTNGRAWILQIAKNHALNVINKNKRVTYFDQPPEIAYHQDFSDGTVSAAMQKVLTEEEQRIIILHVLWGYKHREIAQMLSVPTGTVTSKYKRAVEKLKKELKEKGL